MSQSGSVNIFLIKLKYNIVKQLFLETDNKCVQSSKMQ